MSQWEYSEIDRALRPLVCQALIGVDDEHSHARFAGGNLLNQRLWRRRFLACRNADRAFDPWPGRALDIVEHFTAAAAIAADNVAVPALLQLINVLARCHAAIADQHDAFEPKALLQIAHYLGNRLGVAPITLKHMMGDRPAVDHDQA